jgi:uncharacterized protein YkwD
MRHLLIIFALLGLVVSGCRRSSEALVDVGPHINRAEILLMHNRERSMKGIDQLQYDSSLEETAQKWAEWMARQDSLTHSRLNLGGTSFHSMGENIAMGYHDIDTVLKGWMDSSGHRRNILNAHFNHAGFGYAKLEDGPPFWCAQFGGR